LTQIHNDSVLRKRKFVHTESESYGDRDWK
jgi:hypothetical protein